jgi:formylglycine-generating enzyme
MRPIPLLAIATSIGLVATPGAAQNPVPNTAHPAALTNSIGMEFVLIPPGTMTVGKFQPVCPVQGGGGGQGGGGQGGGGQAQPGGQAGAGTAGGAPPTGPLGAGPGGAAGAAGGGGGGAQAPRTPPDPRSQWSAADYALCAELVRRDSSPGFQVTISQPYYIGKHEVTQAQWKQVMGTNPSTFQGDKVTDDADRHPVDNVTWDQAQAFVRRLNELDPGARYRLPTEFEWEYAARGGSTEDGLPWADARAQAQTSRQSTLMVGQKEPNGWGLYDVVGNVWEWVEDYYNDKIFADPTPPSSGTTHVLKGASFLGDVKNLTWTTHGAGPANGWDVGFRVVREAR